MKVYEFKPHSEFAILLSLLLQTARLPDACTSLFAIIPIAAILIRPLLNLIMHAVTFNKQ